MFKKIPIFWKLSLAFIIIILLILLVDFSLERVNDLKSNRNLQTFLTIMIAIILSCGSAWLIMRIFIKRSIRRLADGMNELKEKKFDFRLDENEKDEFGHVRLGGIGHYLAREIEKRMNVETRVTILGHVQRGGTPTAYDRVLATRFGVASVELIKNDDFGKMVALQGNKIVPINLEDAVSKPKTVDIDLYNIAKIFFG